LDQLATAAAGARKPQVNITKLSVLL